MNSNSTARLLRAWLSLNHAWLRSYSPTQAMGRPSESSSSAACELVRSSSALPAQRQLSATARSRASSLGAANDTRPKPTPSASSPRLAPAPSPPLPSASPPPSKPSNTPLPSTPPPSSDTAAMRPTPSLMICGPLGAYVHGNRFVISKNSTMRETPTWIFHVSSRPGTKKPPPCSMAGRVNGWMVDQWLGQRFDELSNKSAGRSVDGRRVRRGCGCG
mmetsp:Transcript_51490/g.143956  ORF Transcript_51490/g.143956 Transcript_51490/m.143956 type:complete len:218 (+) Transcript_51490:397-1050(+)